jgi:hypothetical protein
MGYLLLSVHAALTHFSKETCSGVAMRSIVVLIFVALLQLPLPLLAAQVEEVRALHRSGQTFVTWRECSGAIAYRVYRSNTPIEAPGEGVLLATVAPGSSTDPIEQAREYPLARFTGIADYGSRYVIHDNPDGDPARMLSVDTGIFVHTAKEDGKAHYAVLAIDDTGAVLDGFGIGNRAAAVREQPQAPGAVLLFQRPLTDEDGAPVGSQRFYQHWMDADDWHPGPTGGPAYIFSVFVPAKPRGLVLKLHGYGNNYTAATPMQDMVAVVPGDPAQSWYYGYRDASGEQVVDYTMRRMLMTVESVLRILEAEGVTVDREKLYVFGGSMGATGGSFLAAWHGDVFAGVISSLGAVDHGRNGHWVGDAEKRLWGSRAQNLPTRDGYRVWDRLNLIGWHRAHPEVETAFILDGHASNDRSIPYAPIPEYYAALQEARRPFAAIWGTWGHNGTHDPHLPNHRWWGTFQFNKNESVPAFGNASGNDDPSSPKGQINVTLEWSARENDFAPGSTRDDILDEEQRWAMNLRSTAGDQTANVTPRRCQRFRPEAGGNYRWENWSYANPQQPVQVAAGEVHADRYGLVTVPRVAIGTKGWGNRLVITAIPWKIPPEFPAEFPGLATVEGPRP